MKVLQSCLFVLIKGSLLNESPYWIGVPQETNSEFLYIHQKREQTRSNCGEWKQQSYMQELQSCSFVCFNQGLTPKSLLIESSVLPPKGDFEEHRNNFTQAINSKFLCMHKKLE